ncbi:hypothetical protein FB451DRAFT_1121769 [Mycena latifolia]|nr:hypothetical protein FB451DRAFT_1121769 [Mycena latifolia]
MSTITVPSGLSYMAASLASTIFLLTGQTYMVGRHRDLAGIQYPRRTSLPVHGTVDMMTGFFLLLVYADKEEMATSTAGAHQNTLETLPLVTVLLGTKQPILAASGLGLWMTSRIAYTIGYLTGNPDNVRGPTHISKLN